MSRDWLLLGAAAVGVLVVVGLALWMVLASRRRRQRVAVPARKAVAPATGKRPLLTDDADEPAGQQHQADQIPPRLGASAAQASPSKASSSSPSLATPPAIEQQRTELPNEVPAAAQAQNEHQPPTWQAGASSLESLAIIGQERTALVSPNPEQAVAVTEPASAETERALAETAGTQQSAADTDQLVEGHQASISTEQAPEASPVREAVTSPTTAVAAAPAEQSAQAEPSEQAVQSEPPTVTSHNPTHAGEVALVPVSSPRTRAEAREQYYTKEIGRIEAAAIRALEEVTERSEQRLAEYSDQLAAERRRAAELEQRLITTQQQLEQLRGSLASRDTRIAELNVEHAGAARSREGAHRA